MQYLQSTLESDLQAYRAESECITDLYQVSLHSDSDKYQKMRIILLPQISDTDCKAIPIWICNKI